jgi:hypothetical protein
MCYTWHIFFHTEEKVSVKFYNCCVSDPHSLHPDPDPDRLLDPDPGVLLNANPYQSFLCKKWKNCELEEIFD